jgi:hypothetical protein
MKTKTMKNAYLPLFIIFTFAAMVTPAFAGPVGTGWSDDSQPPPAPASPGDDTQAAEDLPAVIPLTLHEPIPEGYGPDNFPFFIDPLTGLLVGETDLLERRPMAIKVTNHPRYVRPQSGLSKADIVYEYYMEDGIPRFIAIFYGQDPEKVGPVRSGRLFDEHILRMYNALFVFGNADIRVMDYFKMLEKNIVNRLIVESNYDHEQQCGVDPPNRLCRDPEIEGYNTMFANTAELDEYYSRVFGNARTNLNGMVFTTRVPLSDRPGLIIRVRYSLMVYGLWEYTPDSGRYMRSQETQGYANPTMESYAPLTDALTGEQIAADNVVVLIVPHEYYNKTSRSEIYQIFLQGRGRAIVFRDGFAYDAEWVRPRKGGVLQLYTPEGNLFPLKPGTTWFEVMSQYSQISNNGMSWQFTFGTPPDPGRIIAPEGETPLDWYFRDQNPYLPWP